MDDIIMHVAECYSLGEVGIALSGELDSGTLKVGDRVRLSNGAQHFEGDVRRLEIFRKIEPVAQKGDYISFQISSEAGSHWKDAEVRKI